MRADEPGPARGRILLIDDDRVFGIWAAQVLCKRGGHALKHVLDPAAGLRCVQTEPWDLVITDIEMPGMTGIELLKRYGIGPLPRGFLKGILNEIDSPVHRFAPLIDCPPSMIAREGGHLAELHPVARARAREV